MKESTAKFIPYARARVATIMLRRVTVLGEHEAVVLNGVGTKLQMPQLLKGWVLGVCHQAWFDF